MATEDKESEKETAAAVAVAAASESIPEKENQEGIGTETENNQSSDSPKDDDNMLEAKNTTKNDDNNNNAEQNGEIEKQAVEETISEKTAVENDKETDEVKTATDTTTTTTTTTEHEKPTIDIQRPVKRARTAYFIFADDKRSEVQKDVSKDNGSVAAVAKVLGQMWASLSDEEKTKYQEKAAAERQKVAQAVEAWKAAGGTVPDTTAAADTGSLVFPMGRIRKICKLDPEVRGLSKEALLLVTKAAEMALVKIAKESVKTAQIQNRRKILPEDLVQVCSARDQFQFLREDLQDLHRKQQKEAAQTKEQKSKKEVAKTNSKPLTDFFARK